MTSPLAVRRLRPRRPAAAVDDRRGAWFEEQRLRFIESHLFWAGRINRNDLVQRFGIHVAVASLDLRHYQDAAPRNALYDLRRKTYVTGPAFSPLFGPPQPQHLLGHALLEDGVAELIAPFTTLPTLARAVSPVALRNVIVAQREAAAVRIFYRSLRVPEGEWRWIVPQQMIHDGLRWHVRAYCELREDYRDFVISRIQDADTIRPQDIALPDDHDWQTLIELHLAPHAKLTDAQRELVAYDYQMPADGLRVSVRRALGWYFLVSLGLDHDLGPPRQLLQLSNATLRKTLAPRTRASEND